MRKHPTGPLGDHLQPAEDPDQLASLAGFVDETHPIYRQRRHLVTDQDAGLLPVAQQVR